MAETKKAEFRFCPKCWEWEGVYSFTPTPSYCSNCGTEMMDWTLTCECGKPIPPAFRDAGLGFKFPLNKYCPNCGNPTAKLTKQEAKRLRKIYKEELKA